MFVALTGDAWSSKGGSVQRCSVVPDNGVASLPFVHVNLVGRDGPVQEVIKHGTLSSSSQPIMHLACAPIIRDLRPVTGLV